MKSFVKLFLLLCALFCVYAFTYPGDSSTARGSVIALVKALPAMDSDGARTLAIEDAAHAAFTSDSAAYAFSQAVEDVLGNSASADRDDRMYIAFLKAMLACGYPDSVRSEWMVRMVSKNMPGDTVADFEYTDRTGAISRLSGFAGRPLVLFFYDPECEDCHAAAAELAADSDFTARVNDGRLNILALSTLDIDSWKALPQNFPAAWHDGCDNGVLDSTEAFFIPAFPTFYFIDAAGRVVLKEPTVPQLLHAIAAMP